MVGSPSLSFNLKAKRKWQSKNSLGGTNSRSIADRDRGLYLHQFPFPFPEEVDSGDSNGGLSNGDRCIHTLGAKVKLNGQQVRQRNLKTPKTKEVQQRWCPGVTGAIE